MASHWTCCTPRQHPDLERSDLFTDEEWDRLYTEAEHLLKTNSHTFENSIRHQLVRKTLESAKYSNGPREFKPMPLAVESIPNQTYLSWSSSATILGPLTGTPSRSSHPLFTLKSQTLCTKLLRFPSSPSQILFALCQDLTLQTNNLFLVRAKKYILCGGAVLTPQLLFNSGWDSTSPLPIGQFLTEQTMTFCQILLSRKLISSIPSDPFSLNWTSLSASHSLLNPSDPLPIPFSDPDPQIYTPVSHSYPWHTLIHRDAFTYGLTPPSVDQRLIVDLRWYGTVRPVRSNRVTFSEKVKDKYGMPQPTFHFVVPEEDAERAHEMMGDMCEVAGKLGGYLPGSEPRFLRPGQALHVCGTTRAGREEDGERESVCDRYGRVWGTEGKVVVGGCGVIPTGNACNPTLTAVAFAVAGVGEMIRELKGEGRGVEKKEGEGGVEG